MRDIEFFDVGTAENAPVDTKRCLVLSLITLQGALTLTPRASAVWRIEDTRNCMDSEYYSRCGMPLDADTKGSMTFGVAEMGLSNVGSFTHPKRREKAGKVGLLLLYVAPTPTYQ